MRPERNPPRTGLRTAIIALPSNLKPNEKEEQEVLLHIFGDTHGPLEISKINPKRFLGRALNENDVIVICGDFGFPFLPTDCIPEDTLKESGAERYCIKGARAYRQNINWFKSFPCDILFVDGNHDNHDFWVRQPEEKWNGGKIQRLPGTPNVIHLMRGEYYDIDGTTIWCMGGAESIDKEYRTEGETWWRNEVPSYAEFMRGYENLERHGCKADIILTHTLPRSLFPIYFPEMPIYPDNTSIYLDNVYWSANFGYWYCGHMHEDIDKSMYKLRVLYYEVATVRTKNDKSEDEA